MAPPSLVSYTALFFFCSSLIGKRLQRSYSQRSKPLDQNCQAKTLLSSTFVLNYLERMTSPMSGSQSERENIFGPKKRKNHAAFLSPIYRTLGLAAFKKCVQTSAGNFIECWMLNLEILYLQQCPDKPKIHLSPSQHLYTVVYEKTTMWIREIWPLKTLGCLLCIGQDLEFKISRAGRHFIFVFVVSNLFSKTF